MPRNIAPRPMHLEMGITFGQEHPADKNADQYNRFRRASRPCN